MNPTIYHITSNQAWEMAQIQDSYSPESLLIEGFIHCSTQPQLIKTANRFFANQTDLLVLFILVEKLISPLKYELADGELFPHIYGQLNLEAVTKIIQLPSNSQGLFSLPADF